MINKLPTGAKIRVKLTKLDEHGNIIGLTEQEETVDMKEAQKLWQSQMQV